MPLTNEDKSWIAAQLVSVRTDLRSDLTERIDSVRIEMLERIASLRVEMLERIASLRVEMLERIDSVRIEMLERIDSVRMEMLERIEKTETTLLIEFQRWASPVEMRQHSHTAAMRAFDVELEAVTDRVTRLESQTPPAA